MCRSPAAVVVHNHMSESAVVTLKNKQDEQFIPPVYHVLYLPQLDKRLRLMVDTASPLTFINQKTWQDLQQPKLEPTSKVLGAFEGSQSSQSDILRLRCNTQMTLTSVQF